MVEAQLHGDTAALRRILADDFSGTNAFGLALSKADILKLYAAGEIKREQVDLHDVKIRIYGGVAVVTGRAKVKGSFTGKETTGDFRYTRVYVKRNRAWQLVAWQATRVVPQQSTAINSNKRPNTSDEL